MVNPSQLIDTGFVLFVTFTCGYSLFGNRDKSEARTRRWAMELAALQETLRELITEATSAGSNLDRTLQRRKHELEIVLQKINDSDRATGALPNDTWEEREEAPREAPRRARPQLKTNETKRRAAPQAQPEKRKDETYQRPERLEKIERGSEQDSELARRIEIFLDDQPPRRKIAADSVDPAAYKIARRLLEGGKEIHVVARKVGLPVEEVRMIDSMIERSRALPALPDVQLRAGAEEESAEEEGGESYPDENFSEENEAPAARAQTYSRSKRVDPAPAQDKWTDELEDLLEESELEIRRETTFL